MKIESVKAAGKGYLVNDQFVVPDSEHNSDCVAVKKWLNDGNELLPEFDETELLQQEIDLKVAKEKARVLAYSDLLSGSDRFFNEARRKKAQAEACAAAGENDEAERLLLEADEATEAGLKRADEIKVEYPIH